MHFLERTKEACQPSIRNDNLFCNSQAFHSQLRTNRKKSTNVFLSLCLPLYMSTKYWKWCLVLQLIKHFHCQCTIKKEQKKQDKCIPFTLFTSLHVNQVLEMISCFTTHKAFSSSMHKERVGFNASSEKWKINISMKWVTRWGPNRTNVFLSLCLPLYMSTKYWKWFLVLPLINHVYCQRTRREWAPMHPVKNGRSIFQWNGWLDEVQIFWCTCKIDLQAKLVQQCSSLPQNQLHSYCSLINFAVILRLERNQKNTKEIPPLVGSVWSKVS